MESIAELFQAEIEKATFTPEAMKRFDELQAKVQGLEWRKGSLATEVEELEEKVQSLKDELQSEKEASRKLKDELQQLKLREDDFDEADKQVSYARADTREAQASADAYKHCLETIFKPAGFRRSVQKSRSQSWNTRYINGQEVPDNDSWSEDTTEEIPDE